MIGALILAAGTSSRMGRAKQLLPIGGQFMLERVILTVLQEDFAEVAAVIGNKKEEIMDKIQISDRRFRWIVNENFHEGQSTSLQLGVNELEKYNGIMIFLGDLPFIEQTTVHSIYTIGKKKLMDTNERFVVRPKFKGKPGHPVFLGNVEKEFFQTLKGDEGAKQILKEINDKRLIETDDWGVLFDIDTEESYEKGLRMSCLHKL